MKVYYASCNKQWYEEYADLFLNQLPIEIRQRILKFKNWQDACRSLVGKLLLKKALEEFNQDASLNNINYNEYGRPFIRGGIDFNLTHSGGYTVCAIAQGYRIGIDLERMRPIALNHFQSQFTQKEWLKIIQAEQVSNAFFHYWTLKEAIIKADGRGLKIPLQSIIIKQSHAEIQHEVWYHQKLHFHPEYVLHIASERAITLPVHIHKIIFPS